MTCNLEPVGVKTLFLSKIGRMIIRCLLFGVFCCQPLFSSAQKDTARRPQFKKHEIFMELAGHSRSIFSLNYQHLLFNLNNGVFLTLRSGIGYTPGLVVRNIKRKANW